MAVTIKKGFKNQIALKVFVINLKRSKHRRIKVEQQLARLSLDYEIIEAVDGHVLSESEIKSYFHSSYNYFRDLTKGEVGCLLSHRKALKAIVDKALGSALIIEDDVVFSKNIKRVLNTIEKSIQPGAVVSLYGTFPEHCELKKTGEIDNVYYYASPVNGSLVQGAVAYIVSFDAAKSLMDQLFPIRNVFDDWRMWEKENIISDFKVVFPHPIDISDDYSDIHESFGTFALRLKKLIINYNVPLLSRIIIEKRRKERYKTNAKNILIDQQVPKRLFV